MAAMDEFREEREAMKNANLKTKIQYFFDYYKWHTIGVIAAIIFLIALITSVAGNKPSAFSGYLINAQTDLLADNTAATSLATSFAEIAGIDLNKNTASISSTMQYVAGSTDDTSVLTIQRLSVTIPAQETDFVAADVSSFEEFYHLAGFYDLRDIYSEEDLEKYADYLYYVDMDIIREEEAALETGSIEYVSEKYDHFAPEQMADPVPIAICIEDSPKLDGFYTSYEGRVPLGIPQSTQHLDTTLQFVDYLFEGVIAE